MKIDLILKEGDYLTLDGSKVSMKTIKLGKLLKQRKKAGEVIFSYEFPDDTKFSKPKKKKEKIKVTSKKTSTSEGETVSIDDAINIASMVGEETPDTIIGDNEEVVVQVQPKRQAQSSKIKLKRNTQFIDDPNVAKAESKLKPLARVKLKPGAPTEYKYVRMRCRVCGGEEIVPEAETKMYKGMTYRCNSCFG